jgi:hypothetical protein
MKSERTNLLTPEKTALLATKTATLGFDGFIDSIQRVVRSKSASGTTYFNTLKEFGEYTVERSAGNFSLELHEAIKKPGGNMPILALAMAPWVKNVNCIGGMGFPTINPLFAAFPENCNLYSFGEPGSSTALEFSDGKMIMGEMSNLNTTNWQRIADLIGIDKITDLFREADLIGMVNWSELDHASDIWRGIQRDILPRISYATRPHLFFDLADCSKKSVEEITETLALINEFTRCFDVTLGLNRNEAGILYGAITHRPNPPTDMHVIGKEIFHAMNIHTLVIHFHATAIGWTKDECVAREAPRISHPLLSTGAGDNFNAGYCLAVLSGMALADSLDLGHAFASHYMQHGKSLAKKFMSPL